jgi:hypothetical protein
MDILTFLGVDVGL